MHRDASHYPAAPRTPTARTKQDTGLNLSAWLHNLPRPHVNRQGVTGHTSEQNLFPDCSPQVHGQCEGGGFKPGG